MAGAERKRTTATVVCLTFATIPDVFASVRRAPSLPPSARSLFPLGLPSSTRCDLVAIPRCSLFLLTSVLSLLSQTNKLQAELQSRTRLARLDGTFGNFRMQFSNSFHTAVFGIRDSRADRRVTSPSPLPPLPLGGRKVASEYRTMSS